MFKEILGQYLKYLMDLFSSNSANYNSQHNTVELYISTVVNTTKSNDLLISKALRSLEAKPLAVLSSTFSNDPASTLRYKPINCG